MPSFPPQNSYSYMNVCLQPSRGSMPSLHKHHTNTSEKVIDARLQPDQARGSGSVASCPALIANRRGALVNTRHDPPRHKLNVTVPVLAVLPPALFFVPPLAVNEQDGEIHHEEVREDHAPTLRLTRNNVLTITVLEKVRVALACRDRMLSGILDDIPRHGSRQDVRPGHEPVAEIVDVARPTPPPRNKKLGSSGRLDVFQVLDAGVLGVGAEAVLLVVDGAEDVVPDTLHSQHTSDTGKTEIDGVDGEIACLDRVGEGYPDEVAKGKHHAEAVGNDVDRGQNRGLHVQCVKCVNSLRDGDEDNAISDPAKVPVLLHDESEVHDDPAQHAGTELTPRLDVDFTDDGQVDARVQLPTDEPVVQHVAGVAAGCEFTLRGVLGVLDIERGNVAVGGQEVGDEDVGSQNADVVVCDEGPNWEVGAVGDCSCAEEGHDEKGRVPGCLR
jgi:hypothetical protein